MLNDEIINLLNKKLGFSHSSIDKLRIYVNSLLSYNQKYNLISKSTEKNIWFRHIIDCAQIVNYIDHRKFTKIADFGSGAGLPGLVLALYNDQFHVKLYEKSPVKKKFLEEISKILNLRVEIINNVLIDKIEADIIVCRAFKKLPELFRISREKCRKPHKIIILKGKNAQAEINKVSLPPNYRYRLINSITEINSKIILVDAK